MLIPYTESSPVRDVFCVLSLESLVDCPVLGTQLGDSSGLPNLFTLCTNLSRLVIRNPITVAFPRDILFLPLGYPLVLFPSLKDKQERGVRQRGASAQSLPRVPLQIQFVVLIDVLLVQHRNDQLVLRGPSGLEHVENEKKEYLLRVGASFAVVRAPNVTKPPVALLISLGGQQILCRANWSPTTGRLNNIPPKHPAARVTETARHYERDQGE